MIGIVSVLFVLVVAQNIDPTTGRNVAPLRDSVVLTLSADRQTYYRGERVRLTLTVRNSADHAVTGHFELDPALGSARVLYRIGSGQFQELRCFPPPHGSFGLRRRVLGASETRSTDVDVSVATLKPSAFLLEHIGTYEFKIEYQDIPDDSNSTLLSNVVSVDVIDVPAEEQAAQAAYTPQLAYLAQIARGSRAFVPPDRMTAAAVFIDRYRRSCYAGPVREGLTKYLQYRVGTQRARDDERALLLKLTRDDDTSPPELYVAASPATLWPPNHKLESIRVDVSVSDDQDPSPAVSLESITCDDGCDASKDIAGADLGADDRDFELRSERKGAGAGRTYTVTYSATDVSGNKTLAAAVVVVPHDQRRR